MKDLFSPLYVLFVSLVLLAGCANPFAGDTLVALPVEGVPDTRDWERAVPLEVGAWMGNVHIPPEIVALDNETSHRSTPVCHHGPSRSEPVRVTLQALYSREELFLLVQWPDRTQDRELGEWAREASGWSARPGADDGLAILWEPPASRRDEEPFRCQLACHMTEVDVYDGTAKMRMGMRAPEGKVMDLWRWRAAVTDPFGLADDMVIDEEGKRGDERQVLPRVNRSQDSPGPARTNGTVAPYYLVQEPVGRQADVRARARWEGGRWNLLLRRDLDTADPDDVVFVPGGEVPFSVSVFDNTFLEHHVSASSAVLILWEGGSARPVERHIDEPMDF